jgi:hypothetical protein
MTCNFVDVEYAFNNVYGFTKLSWRIAGQNEYNTAQLEGDDFNIAQADFTDGNTVYAYTSYEYSSNNYNYNFYNVAAPNSINNVYSISETTEQIKDFVYENGSLYYLTDSTIKKYTLGGNATAAIDALTLDAGYNYNRIAVKENESSTKYAYYNLDEYKVYVTDGIAGLNPTVIDVLSITANDVSSNFTVADLAFADDILWILVSECISTINGGTIYSRGALIKYNLTDSTNDCYGWNTDNYITYGSSGSTKVFSGPVQFLAVNSKKITIADCGIEVDNDNEKAYHRHSIVTLDLENPSNELNFDTDISLKFGNIGISGVSWTIE